jgi:hypothetical protein
MPIRLNLLAEAQAAEEMRRRDPVKRAIWLGGFLVVLMLAFCSILQLNAITAQSELSRVEAQLANHANEYKLVQENEAAIASLNQKINALQNLAAARSRTFGGTLLNALQQTTVDDVQLVRLHIEQSYLPVDGIKPRTNEAGNVIPGRPATVTEQVLLTLDALDSSPNPGDQVSRFRQALATNSYFRTVLVPTNGISLKNLYAPQVSAGSGKTCQQFTLECRYSDLTR